LFRGADCDTNHCLVVETVKDILAMIKKYMRRFHMERFNLNKLNEEEDKEHYRVEI
jgi:hypothetical protein